MPIREYRDSIGFHVRHQKKKSVVIYEKLNIISYVEVVICYKGITDKSLIKGSAKRLVGKVKEKGSISWPPKISKLEEPKLLNSNLIKFLSCLGMPKVSSPERDPLVLSLAFALTSFITKERTKILNSVTLYGITRSKELAEVFYKQRFGISYAHYARDLWVLSDLENASVCSPELNIGKPRIQIADNGNLRSDTLT